MNLPKFILEIIDKDRWHSWIKKDLIEILVLLYTQLLHLVQSIVEHIMQQYQRLKTFILPATIDTLPTPPRLRMVVW